MVRGTKIPAEQFRRFRSARTKIPVSNTFVGVSLRCARLRYSCPADPLRFSGLLCQFCLSRRAPKPSCEPCSIRNMCTVCHYYVVFSIYGGTLKLEIHAHEQLSAVGVGRISAQRFTLLRSSVHVEINTPSPPLPRTAVRTSLQMVKRELMIT